jgi:hypothetical protein
MSYEVEVHVPTRVTTDPDALAADDGRLVEDAVAAAGDRALERSLDVVRQRHGEPHQVIVHPPAITWKGPGLASVPAATRSRVEQRVTGALAGQGARLQSRRPPRKGDGRRRSAAPWRVVKSVDFRARGSDLLGLVEQLGGERGLSALHAEHAGEERTATLRVIEVTRAVALDAVVAGIVRTLDRRPGQQLLYGFTVYPEDRVRIAFLDPRGTLAAELPDLSLNLMRAAGTPDGVLLGPGALVAFVSFYMPAVVAEERIGTAPETEVSVALRELGFLIEPTSFESAFGVTWESYAAEFGDRPATLRLQTFFTKAPIRYETLDQLLRAAIAHERVQAGSWFFGKLCLLTEERLTGLPEAVRTMLAPDAHATTRMLGRDREQGVWETGWDGTFVYAVLTPDRAETAQALERGLARERADELIALLAADRGELLWPYNILAFLRRHYRGPRSDPFEPLLRELQQRDGGSWFDRLFDWVEAEENGDLHWMLVDLCSRGSYARHPRVTASADLLNNRRRAYLPHLYFADRCEIWLDRSPYRVLKKDQRIDSIDTDYRSEKVEKLLKPEAEQRLIAAMKTYAPQFIEELLTGRIKEEFADGNALLEGMVRYSAAKLNPPLGKDDLYERTTERTLKLLGLERRVDPFERYLVTYEVWEHVYTEFEDEDNVPWKLVADSTRTDTDVDFQWLVWGWEYGHEAARMEIFAIGVVAVSMLPIVAIGVPVLLEIAGGWQIVATSIAFSEGFYVGFTLGRGEKFTVEGFVMAAVDGYIGALGFRAGSVPASLLARRIGTATWQRVLAGWIAERTVSAMIGGAGSAAMMQFTHDLVNISLRGGKFSKPEEYVRGMKWGLLIGFAVEAGAPLGKALFRSAGGEAAAIAALETADDVVRAARAAGLSPAAWAEIMREILAAIRPKLRAGFKGPLAESLEWEMMARFAEVGKALAANYRAAPGFSLQLRRLFIERVLAVSGVQLGRAATPGLLRLARLSAELDQEAALTLLRRLRDSGRTDSFFRGLAAVDDETAAALMSRGELESLATSTPALDALAQRRAFLENVGRAPPKSPARSAQRAAGDLVMHPRYANVLIDPVVGADRFEAMLKELRRTPEGEQIAQAIVDGRLHVIVHPEEIFSGYAGTQIKDEIFAQWTGSVEDTASTLLHEGTHWLDPNRFIPGVKQTGPGSSRLLLEATARANEFELRWAQGLHPQDDVENAFRNEYERVLAETGDVRAARRAADQAIIDGLRKDPARYGVESAAQEQRRLAAAREEMEEALDVLSGGKPPPSPSRALPSRRDLQVELNALEWRHGAEVETSTSAHALYDELDQARKFVADTKNDLAAARERVAKLTALWRAEAELAQLRIGAESKFAPRGSTEAAAAVPVRTGVGGKKSIEGLRQVPDLPADAPALPPDRVQVTHRPFTSAEDKARLAEILELHKREPAKAGLEFERFVIEREGPPGTNLDRPGRRPDIGGTEITLVGMEGGLSAHKLQQLWLDLVDTRRIHLIVPEASELTLFELAQLGHAAEDLLQVSVSIEVVVTK